MSLTNNSTYQKEYLKKYLSGDVKKKKKKQLSAGNIKRSVIVDDDIDLKSLRPLEDDEVELYQMDEDAPQIAGIIDERPAEVKAQEYYSSKRWKVFGGEDGINVVDSKDEQNSSDKPLKSSNDYNKYESLSQERDSNRKSELDKTGNNKIKPSTDKLGKKKFVSYDDNFSPHRQNKFDKNVSRTNLVKKCDHSSSDESPPRRNKRLSRCENDSDLSPPRNVGRSESTSTVKKAQYKNNSDLSPPRKDRRSKSPLSVKKNKSTSYGSDSDLSPPRQYERTSRKNEKIPDRFSTKRGSFKNNERTSNNDSNVTLSRNHKLKKHRSQSDSDDSSLRKDHRIKSREYSNKYQERKREKTRNRSYSPSSPRRGKSRRHKYKSDSDNSPPRHEKRLYKKDNSDSDASPPHKKDRYPQDSTRGKTKRESSSDSSDKISKSDKRTCEKLERDKKSSRRKTTPENNSSYSEKSKKSIREESSKVSSRPKGLNNSSSKKYSSDSDTSSPRRRQSSGSDSDLSPPRKSSENNRPLKKALYKPNDDSSSDEPSKVKGKKMKTTLDGKQAGLQNAKQLKKELSDLKMKEDAMFSKMDASVSGVGAAVVKRDRKTGQVRDLEKEEEFQREKEAKESVIKEKYYKWGKGIKQTEDAAVRAVEVMKEMSKPLARYVDDQDLDDFLKAQDREGDPMLDYIKSKQSEATSLAGEKPIYKGSWNPNRFNIRPGYRWDGVVRSNGYEKEWFKTQNAKKARDEEAYKWSTSDM